MIYEPKEDSFLLEKQVKHYAKNKNILDLGSGSGIQALAAKKAGAKSILASDISQESVNYVNSLGIKCIKSNLFSNIKGNFYLVVFNPPYLPKDKREDKASARTTTGGKLGDEIILRFLKQAKSHLNKDGIILIVISSLTPLSRINSLLEKLSLTSKVFSHENYFFEKLEVWKIKGK